MNVNYLMEIIFINNEKNIFKDDVHFIDDNDIR